MNLLIMKIDGKEEFDPSKLILKNKNKTLKNQIATGPLR